MSVGDVTIRSNVKRDVVIMEGQTTNTGAPSAATDGVECYQARKNILTSVDEGVFTFMPASKSRLFISGTAYGKAELDLDTVGDIDTVIRMKTNGTVFPTIQFVADGSGVGTLDESDPEAVVFHFESGVTTVGNFETAVAAGDVFEVSAAGTGAQILATPNDVFGPTALALAVAVAGTFTLWGYLESADAWAVVSTAPGALSETSPNKIGYTVVYDCLSHFDRLFLQLASVADGSFDAYLISASESF
jgi:hypothetical protein